MSVINKKKKIISYSFRRGAGLLVVGKVFFTSLKIRLPLGAI